MTRLTLFRTRSNEKGCLANLCAQNGDGFFAFFIMMRHSECRYADDAIYQPVLVEELTHYNYGLSMIYSSFRYAIVLVLFLLTFPVLAQSPTDTSSVSISEAANLLETLKDDDKRAAFVSNLEAMVAVQKQHDAETEKSLGSLVLETVSVKMDAIGIELSNMAKEIGNIPKVFASARAFFADSDKRGTWLALIGELALILAVGMVAERLAKRLLRRFHNSIESQAPESFSLRIFLAVLRTVLNFVAVAAFVAASYATMTLLAPAHEGRVLALAFINANVIARIILVVSRMFLAPYAPSMRLLPMSDETAQYSLHWIRRLVYFLAYGYFLAEIMPALGASHAAQIMVTKLVGLTTTGMLIILIMQMRQDIAQRIRGNAGLPIGQIRDRVADIWHLVAILYVIVTFGVWAFEVPGGFDYVLRSSALSIIIIAVSYTLSLLVQKGLRKAFAINEEQKLRFPGLQARTNRYLPVLNTGAQFILYGAAGLAVFRVWGLDAVGWLTSPTGATLAKSAVNIVIIIIIALVVWELIGAAIERYLSTRDNDGNEVERGQRALTLLPLLRNIVMVTLAVLVTLSVLSELGVNIGPLIAGAGIIGLAVGFGAQTFVKDVITGFFILIEDSVAVGDLVVLGDYRGKVEAISIRSIQLRDLKGDVHRIPFSEVTSTTNRSKIFSFASFDIGVAYREDVDHCMNVIREVGDEMRQDENFASMIMEDIEIMGVQSFDDSAVIIRARLKVQPGKQLGVQRAFNRLIKNRFDAESIEIPFPHRTIYFGVDGQGNAPSAHVQLHESENARERRPKATLVKAPEGEHADFDDEPTSVNKDEQKDDKSD